MKSKFFILSILLLFFIDSRIVHAESLEKIINSADSKIINPYDTSQTIQTKCSGWSKKNWYVSLANDDVQINNFGETRDYYLKVEELLFEVPIDAGIESPNQSKTVFPVQDGYLISFYAGEWGGSLWWFSKNGENKKAVIPYKPSYQAISFVNEFMPTNDGLYALVGLAHLSLDSGGIVKLENIKEEGWRISKFIDLSSSASAYFRMDDNNFLILTNKKVVHFSLSGESKTLYEPLDDMFGVSGNSIVQDKIGNIYIGDRYKVSKLKPVVSGYTEEWIIPEYCEWSVDLNAVCHCQSE